MEASSHPWALNPEEKLSPQPSPSEPTQPASPPDLNDKIDFVRMCRKYTLEAIQILVSGLKSQSEKTRLRCAERLLDRAWGKPKEEIEVGISHNISAEAVIAALMEAQGDVYLLPDANGSRGDHTVRPLPSQLLGLPSRMYSDPGPSGQDPAD